MPFTTAHIVAIIPFKKYTPNPLSISGLVIGSMVPDFEYFIRMTLFGHYGHTIGGIFFFDLPIGLILYIIFHAIVRKSTIVHLPNYLYFRVGSADCFDWKPYFKKCFFKIIISIFIGILTHFFWDGFTHDKEYFFAKYMTILLHKINIFGHLIPLHFVLQMFSTLIGMIILFWYIHTLPVKPKNQIKTNKQIVTFWILVLLLAIIIGVVRWSIGMPNEKIIGQLIVVSVSASLLSLIIISFFSSKQILTKFI
jgi:Domain of unknown function (DUF4184)